MNNKSRLLDVFVLLYGKGEVYISQIENKLGVSKRTVQRHLKILRERKLIKFVSKGLVAEYLD
jgi:transcription initiation factor IIE alpha subunit